MEQKLPLDVVLSFCRDKISGKGEDSYCHSFCDTAGILGVFDGCGGAGAKTHACYSGKSEAYMASRLCAGAVYDGFCEAFPNEESAEKLQEALFAPVLKQRLSRFAPRLEAGEVQVGGSMVRVLPTTAAIALVRPGEPGFLQVDAFWAGDSRVYVLDSEGLAQLTVDHTSVPDPMENLYEDGLLRNILTAGKKPKLQHTQVRVKLPCLVFAATDGCFGYLSTPMEFESLLLQTLCTSDSAAAWEQSMADRIGGVAGDDHTLMMAAFGYGSFGAIQNQQKTRSEMLLKEFVEPIRALALEDRETRRQYWQRYEKNYLRMIKDGSA